MDDPSFQKAAEFIASHEGNVPRSRGSEGLHDAPVACSNCFVNQGLRLDAELGGVEEDTVCPNCGSQNGRKLSEHMLETLAHRFFVRGTFHQCDYGAAPVIQFNAQRKSDISVPNWLDKDVAIFEKLLGVGFFYYGPRLWMVGENEPLEALQDRATRKAIVERILAEYPSTTIDRDQRLYRLRTNPETPADISQYDTPPVKFLGGGRFDSEDLPIMYASQDLEVCIHECRVTAEDNLFVSTLAPQRELKFLDLTALLAKEDETEFESLDMAVHMLFLAGRHSYEIARDIGAAARSAGYDSLVYPSYFSLLRTGGMPFETIYGISHRQVPAFSDRERSKIVPNLAIFGRPIADGLVQVKCVNKLMLERVAYQVYFGPVGYGEPSAGDSIPASPQGRLTRLISWLARKWR